MVKFGDIFALNTTLPKVETDEKGVKFGDIFALNTTCRERWIKSASHVAL
jgi:hypothetical protein